MSSKYGAIVALGVSALIACNRAQTPPPGARAMPPTAVVLAEATPRPIEDATEYVATLKSLTPRRSSRRSTGRSRRSS